MNRGILKKVTTDEYDKYTIKNSSPIGCLPKGGTGTNPYVIHTAFNPDSILSKETHNARYFSEYFSYHTQRNQNINIYLIWGLLESKLEKYAKKQFCLNSEFNILLYSDEQVDNLISIAHKQGEELSDLMPFLTDEAKEWRKSKFEFYKMLNENINDFKFIKDEGKKLVKQIPKNTI